MTRAFRVFFFFNILFSEEYKDETNYIAKMGKVGKKGINFSHERFSSVESGVLLWRRTIP